MKLTRRRLLQCAAASAPALALAPGWALAELALPGMTLTTLSDGYLQLPESFLTGDLPQEELRAILDAAGVPPGRYTPPCNVTLLRRGADTVLFDAGAGPGFMQSAGQLPDALDALGVAPEEITHVVFTHGHPDHLWGAVDDFDEPLFANARHLMGRAERDYWRDPATLDSIGAERQSFAAGAARRLEILGSLLEVFDDGEEILPAVTARASYGHTPGHMGFELGQGPGADTAWIAGDAIGNAHVALARPEWPSAADQDPETGAKTRVALLERLAESGTAVIGFHLPEGGMGRISRADGGYRFTPL
ncbi:MBL fold metallo-hydrolase [Cribrihabitans neustonicus]|uniref:MBL fold metallo-hydrolase n=1 Tax=Cribrihabitans neustonicus TaxID=1429085 RepID=UPI003B591794